MVDILILMLIIFTILGTFLIFPLNTILFNRRIRDFFEKSGIRVFLFFLLLIGAFFGLALASMEFNIISHGITSPLPWEALELALFEEKGSFNVFLAVISNLLYLLWIFILPAHILSWPKNKEKGKRPFYYYAINLAIGVAIVVYQVANPMSGY